MIYIFKRFLVYLYIYDFSVLTFNTSYFILVNSQRLKPTRTLVSALNSHRRYFGTTPEV